MEEKNKYKLITNDFEKVDYQYGEFNKPYKKYTYWGFDNLQPQRMLSLMNNSGMHSSILKRKSQLTSGAGWESNEANKVFIENVNGTEDLNDIANKLSYDIWLQGICFINVIHSDDGSIAQIEHIPAECVRIIEEDDYKYYEVSKDWNDVRKNKPIPFAPYNPDDKENKVQILEVKQYVPGHYIYSSPSYIGGLRWIEIDSAISAYHLSSIERGFSGSFMLTFLEGKPTDEEERYLYESIKKSLTGQKNAGEMLLNFAESLESAPKLEPIPLNDSDKKYTQLMNIIISEIMSTHQLTAPELAGISTPSKLSSASETVDAEIRFFEITIEPVQKLIERAFTKLSTINGSGDMKLIDVVTKNTLDTAADTNNNNPEIITE